jgi:hypothetical protein
MFVIHLIFVWIFGFNNDPIFFFLKQKKMFNKNHDLFQSGFRV